MFSLGWMTLLSPCSGLGLSGPPLCNLFYLIYPISSVLSQTAACLMLRPSAETDQYESRCVSKLLYLIFQRLCLFFRVYSDPAHLEQLFQKRGAFIWSDMNTAILGCSGVVNKTCGPRSPRRVGLSSLPFESCRKLSTWQPTQLTQKTNEPLTLMMLHSWCFPR